MLNCLRRKLASRRGASITFALLLFLVCTVIGVIVLVAATAAAGRISKLAEADARYYAVNSAAQLLREEIESQSVVVTRVKTEAYTATTTTYAGTPVIRHTWDLTIAPTYSGRITYSPAFPFLEKTATYCVFDNASPVGSAECWDRDPNSEITSISDSSPTTLQTLELELSSDTLSPMTVQVEAKLSRSGKLLVTVSYTEGETYTVTMTFDTMIDDGGGVKLGKLPPNSGTAPANTVPDETATTETGYADSYKDDTFKWKFTGIKAGA